MRHGSGESTDTTAWGSFATALAEGGWLAAIILVATFFDTDTARIFEEEKMFLFRSVALVVAVAWAAAVIEGGGGAALRAMWRRPLVKPVVLLGGVYLIAVPFSIAPGISFWGAYDRAQGAYAWLCYVAVFLAIVSLVRRRAQVERLVATVLLASLPLALYGVIQRLGTDPIEWIAQSFPRVHSMAGNSIFLAALLVMIIPLTLLRLCEGLPHLWRGWLAPGAILFLAYLALLVLQILAMVYSQSRGPFLGLCAGLAILLVAFAACTGRRWIAAAAIAATAAGISFLVVFNLPQSPLSPLRSVPYVGRLGQLGLGVWSSARVRVLVWQSVVDLLVMEPQRLVLGYGPDAFRFAFPRVRPAEMSYHESRNVVADRSHNETFDTLVMTGVTGVVAEIVLFVSLFFWIVRWLGLLRSRPQRNGFLCLVLGGAFVAVTGVSTFAGLRFSGVALPFGMVGGLFLYLVAATIGRFTASNEVQGDRLLLLILLGATVIHYVEIQFGIAVVATRLVFFVYAALAAVVGRGPVRREQEPTSGPLVGSSLAPLAWPVGLCLVFLTFDFYRLDLDLRQHGLTLAVLAAAVWAFGLLLVASDWRPRDGIFARVASFSSTSLGVWLLFLAVYLPHAPSRSVSVAEQTAAQVNAAASRPIQSVTILYAFVLAVLLLCGFVLYLRDRTPLRSERFPRLRGVAYGGLLAVAVAVAVNTNLSRSWADVLAAHGTSYEASGSWRAAALAYAAAERAVPRQGIYASQLGFALLGQARRTDEKDWEKRHDLLQQSLEALRRARRSNPANLDHTRNLAKLHHAWSTLDPDPQRARRHLETSESLYRHLSVAMPHNAGLMNEWATLYIDHGDLQAAIRRLDDSLRIDGSYYTTHWLRGNVLMQAGAFEEALAAYDQTLRLAPRLPAAMSGKALSLAALGRLDEAIRVSEQAVSYDGADLVSRRNLITLLQRKGDRERALEQARAALTHAHGDEVIQLRELIARLESADGGQEPGGGSTQP